MVSYKIISKIRIPSMVSLREMTDRKWGILYFRGLDGELLYTSKTNKNDYFTRLLNENDGLTEIYNYTIKLDKPAYHILSWDDVRKSRCSDEQRGKIQMNEKGEPLVYEHFCLYCSGDVALKKRISMEFIEMDSPILFHYL